MAKIFIWRGPQTYDDVNEKIRINPGDNLIIGKDIREEYANKIYESFKNVKWVEIIEETQQEKKEEPKNVIVDEPKKKK